MMSERSSLVEALRLVAFDAGCRLLGAGPKASAPAARYNVLCQRLVRLDPAVAAVYRPLPAQAPAGCLRLAARDVAAFAETRPASCCP